MKILSTGAVKSIYKEGGVCYNASTMPDIPNNPLTNVPASGPGSPTRGIGYVDRYYAKGGVTPEAAILREGDLVDRLEKASPDDRKQFLGYAQEQLDSYYKMLGRNPDDQKRLADILKGDLETKSAMERYTNQNSAFNAIVNLYNSGKLDGDEIDPGLRKSLVASLRKSGVTVANNATPEEIKDKTRQVGMKLRGQLT